MITADEVYFKVSENVTLTHRNFRTSYNFILRNYNFILRIFFKYRAHKSEKSCPCYLSASSHTSGSARLWPCCPKIHSRETQIYRPSTRILKEGEIKVRGEIITEGYKKRVRPLDSVTTAPAGSQEFNKGVCLPLNSRINGHYNVNG